MESGKLDSERETNYEKLAFESMWDNLCAYYLSVGLPVEEYWHGDYTNFKYYVEAHRLKLKEQNYFAYLNGLYNFQAVTTAISNFHMDGKSHKVNEYLDKPIDLFAIPLTQEEKQKIELEKAIRYFDAMKINDRKE